MSSLGLTIFDIWADAFKLPMEMPEPLIAEKILNQSMMKRTFHRDALVANCALSLLASLC